MKSSVMHLLIVFVMSMSITAIGQHPTHAAGKNIISWPIGRPGRIAYTQKNGLNITVDSAWAGDQGYRPIKFTISSATPVIGDTQITVRFAAGSGRDSEMSILAEQDLELKQGTNSTTNTILLPQYTDWQMFSWEVWIDGIKDSQLTPIQKIIPPSANPSTSAIFFASKDLTSYFDKLSTVIGIDVAPHFSSDLPENWKHYTALDYAVVSPEDLKRWHVTSPKKLAHLLRWVRTGGNLWVIETGEEYSNLKLVESILDITSSSKISGSDSTDLSFEQRGWLALPLTENPMDNVEAALLINGLKRQETDESETEIEKSAQKFVGDSSNQFVARGYGMGIITAFPRLFGNSSFDMRITKEVLDQTLLAKRTNWHHRHGNNPDNGNIEFGKFLIPDVGTAPVIEFQLLISLFVIVIGPLNYWLLHRRHQLPLMLITVPLSALAATTILFAYGFLADGFGVRARVRSLTTIDQHQGEAVCWARLSYYAGLAPAEGLTIPSDTIIYPILPARTNSNRSRNIADQQRTVSWDTQQHLTQGWLGSRTPTQYLAISARPSRQQISFKPSDTLLSATNQLNSKILQLFVRDHQGNFFIGDNVDVEQTISLKASNSQSTIAAMRKIISDNDLEYPPGLELAQSNNRRAQRRSRDYIEPLESQGLLEDTINAYKSPLSKGLAPGTYLAVTAEGTEVSLGLDEVTESASFHLVQGTWSND